MTRRGALFVAAVGASIASLAMAACLPEYTFRTDAASADGSVDGRLGDALVGDGALLFDASSSVLFDMPAGGTTFNFRIDKTGGGPTSASATLTHAFYMDRYEVTVNRFRKYLETQPAPCTTGTCSLDPGGTYATKMQWLASWNALRSTNIDSAVTSQCTEGPASFGPFGTNAPEVSGPGGSDFPITCVNWFDAVAFCASEGKRLPTEMEWQYAATSQGTNPSYPWIGSTDTTELDCAHAIIDVGLAQSGGGGCHFPRVVGSAPLGASTEGIFDLSGSVFEWVWDVGDSLPNVIPTDYAGAEASAPNASTPRVRRGGSFNSLQEDGVVRNYGRREGFPASPTFNDMGFRCAKTAP